MNNFFIEAAPLQGYTDYIFRNLHYQYFGGIKCYYTPFIRYEHETFRNRDLRDCAPENNRVARLIPQLIAAEPQELNHICTRLYGLGYHQLDINMGCPVPKVYKNGEGSALLADLPRAERIISACKKSGKTVTVKFRIGLDKNSIVAAEFAGMCEGAGADMITVHGRTRDMYYAGEPDYAQIAAAKEAVNIPVIANGGVFSRADAEKLLRETGADGVMVARAALYDPHIFSEILGSGGGWSKRAAVLGQIEDMLPFYGEQFTLVQMRKMAAFYLRGTRGGAKLRAELLACPSVSRLREMVGEIYAEE